MGTKEEELRAELHAVVLDVLARELPGHYGMPKVQDHWLATAVVEAADPLFRRTAEQAWDEGFNGSWAAAGLSGNPYRVSVEGNE